MVIPNQKIAPNYKKWIDTYYYTMESAFGNCHTACLRMQEEFPELKMTNGFVHLSYNSVEQPHWWLKDLAGNIIDPTFRQFDGHLILEYKEIDDTHPARNHPRQKCPNCGEYYYVIPSVAKHNPCCTAKCIKEFIEYLNGSSDTSDDT